MSNDDQPNSKGETFGRAGGYDTESGESTGEFGDGGQAGGVVPEVGGYTGQTGTGYGTSAGGDGGAGVRMRDAVTARLDGDPFLDSTRIEVMMEGTEVRLSGLVTARGDRRRAEDLAKAVEGVTRVHDDLGVDDASDD